MDALKALQSLGLEPDSGSSDGDKLLQQAQQVWSMLDEMADSDPQAYRRFIQKQKEEQQQLMAPPQACMCIKTKFKEEADKALYINVMSWPRVPKPKTEQDNISYFATPLESFKEKKTGVTVSTISVAVNPAVAEEFGPQSKDIALRNDFIRLTQDYVQHICGKEINRNFQLMPPSVQFTGNLEKAHKFFVDVQKNAMKKKKPSATCNGDEADPVSDISDSIMSKLASISKPADSSDKSYTSSNEASADKSIRMPEARHATHSARPLIQELKSEEARLVEPRYTLEKSADDLVLKIQLPGVTSVSQCQLDISEDDVKLHVEGRYDLTVKLTSRINDSEASAKFIKKQCLLTLTMPCAFS